MNSLFHSLRSTWTTMAVVAFVTCFCGCSVHLQAQTAMPQVKIDSGTLEGAWVPGASHIASFLGIPYAAQPIGNLRWKAPQLPPSWSGVRKATKYGPACPQAPSPWLPEMLGIPQMVTNEACLYLNVWTPRLSGTAKLPVMVWVHGGGNVEGSAEWPLLGSTLAQQGVIVVSLNYRLGVFGFFANRALSAESPHRVSGNYGHLDQVEALRWVKRNIRRFGGDPNQVTVFGASSGALDICNLMASPIAAKLFQRAILQSGVCVDSVYPVLRQAEANGDLLADDLGIQNSAHSLVELRALPAERLLRAAAKDGRIDLEPAVDGWFFPEQPAIAFANGRQAKIPVIVGSNNDEISIFASPLVAGKSYRPKTVAEYRRWLRREFGPFADKVFTQYPAESDQDVPGVFRTMDTDFDFGFGARLLAIEMANVHQPAYLYHFTYVGTGEFTGLGAFHSEESMFLSKKYWTSWIRRPYDETLSNTIIGYWVKFAQTGNPNRFALSSWPAYLPTTDFCQELGQRIGPESVPRAKRFGVFQQFLNSRLEKSPE